MQPVYSNNMISKKVVRQKLYIHEWIASLDNYNNPNFIPSKKLEDFGHLLKYAETNDKWRTWGRTYIEVPIEVLSHFGIVSNLPITFYVNYVNWVPKNYVYGGAIFTGDAAWFDSQNELDTLPVSSESFRLAKEALENESNSTFLSYFNRHKQKWNEVPIHHPLLADVASKLSLHI